MPFDPNLHRRRSIRLKDYDYTQSGAYFVTICTHGRECLFGEIDANGNMILSQYGEMVQDEWFKTAIIRSYVDLDAFVVMPNHVHGIILITSDAPVGATRRVAPTPNDHHNPKGPKSKSLGAIVGSFKSSVSRHINEWRETAGAPVWQRDYYDVVIRNEAMLNTRRQYIETNPSRWAFDENNPLRIRH